jgi:hypothetical protein
MPKRVLYLGVVHGGHCYPFGDVTSEGEAFTSRADAWCQLRRRVTGNGRCEVSYPVISDDGDMVRTRPSERTDNGFPLLPENAFVDLYRVVPSEHSGWGYLAPEPEFRIMLGPRGGMRCEPF